MGNLGLTRQFTNCQESVFVFYSLYYEVSSFKLSHGHKLAASAPAITFQAERRKVKKKCCHPAESVYFREFSQMLPEKVSAYVWGHYVLLDKIGRVDIR